MTLHRSTPVLALFAGFACLSVWGQSADRKPPGPRWPSHPDFKPTPAVPAMPKALMKLPRPNITRAKYPALDSHLHGSSLKTAAAYERMIKLIDESGIGLSCNMDGGFG